MNEPSAVEIQSTEGLNEETLTAEEIQHEELDSDSEYVDTD